MKDYEIFEQKRLCFGPYEFVGATPMPPNEGPWVMLGSGAPIGDPLPPPYIREIRPLQTKTLTELKELAKYLQYKIGFKTVTIERKRPNR